MKIKEMTFKLVADCEFKAENIDDAFMKLSEHFKDLAENGTDTPFLFTDGEAKIGQIFRIG